MLRTTCLAATLVASLGASSAGSGILGVWRVENGEAYVELAPCSNRLCGTIVWLDEPRLPDGVHKTDLNNPDPAMRGLQGREIFDRAVETRAPMKKALTPEDIGNLAAFLASDDAHNITGQAINVDGGSRMN